jgi:uncharacterized protein YjbI with pentapeptide repeats
VAVLQPRVTEPRLPELRESDGATLGAGDFVERMRFDSIDLSGRDLSELSLSECALAGVRLDEATLRGAAFDEVLFTGLTAATLQAARARWHTVEVDSSRIGAGELYDAGMRGVTFGHCKIGFLNLAGSTLDDVLFTGCSLDELDLSGARLARVAFRNCTIGTLTVSGARSSNVDLRGTRVDAVTGLDGLRGATIDEDQLAALMPLLVRSAGILLD